MSYEWVFVRHKQTRDGQSLKPSFCHPLYWKTRAAYIFETYGARIEELQRIDCLHLDFGGMVRTTDPAIDVQVGKARGFSCWKHQASMVVSCLEHAEPVKHGRVGLLKFARPPGVICYISEADRRKILAVVKPAINAEAEAEHSEAMHEKLVEVNVRGRGPEVEVSVRAMMRGPHPNN